MTDGLDPRPHGLVLNLAQQLVELRERLPALLVQRLVLLDHLADFLEDVSGNSLGGKLVEQLHHQVVLARLAAQFQLAQFLLGAALHDRPEDGLESLAEVGVVGRIGEDAFQCGLCLDVSVGLKVEASDLLAPFDVALLRQLGEDLGQDVGGDAPGADPHVPDVGAALHLGAKGPDFGDALDDADRAPSGAHPEDPPAMLIEGLNEKRAHALDGRAGAYHRLTDAEPLEDLGGVLLEVLLDLTLGDERAAELVVDQHD